MCSECSISNTIRKYLLKYIILNTDVLIVLDCARIIKHRQNTKDQTRPESARLECQETPWSFRVLQSLPLSCLVSVEIRNVEVRNAPKIRNIYKVINIGHLTWILLICLCTTCSLATNLCWWKNAYDNKSCCKQMVELMHPSKQMVRLWEARSTMQSLIWRSTSKKSFSRLALSFFVSLSFLYLFSLDLFFFVSLDCFSLVSSIFFFFAFTQPSSFCSKAFFNSFTWFFLQKKLKKLLFRVRWL